MRTGPRCFKIFTALLFRVPEVPVPVFFQLQQIIHYKKRWWWGERGREQRAVTCYWPTVQSSHLTELHSITPFPLAFGKQKPHCRNEKWQIPVTLTDPVSLLIYVSSKMVVNQEQFLQQARNCWKVCGGCWVEGGFTGGNCSQCSMDFQTGKMA